MIRTKEFSFLLFKMQSINIKYSIVIYTIILTLGRVHNAPSIN